MPSQYMANETLATKEENTSTPVCVMGEKGESSFIFLRREGQFIWAWESTTAEDEDSLKEEWQAAKQAIRQKEEARC